MVFIDLEKAYDRILCEVLRKCLKKKGIAIEYVQPVEDMYDGVKTSGRS